MKQKEALRRVVIAIVAVAMSIFVTVLVMVYGWGLQPKSWWWIIGAYAIGRMIAEMMMDLAKGNDE